MVVGGGRRGRGGGPGFGGSPPPPPHSPLGGLRKGGRGRGRLRWLDYMHTYVRAKSTYPTAIAPTTTTLFRELEQHAVIAPEYVK